MSLPPKVSRRCARLRRVSPVFWALGLILILALGRDARYWTGPAAFLLCAVSVTSVVVRRAISNSSLKVG